MGISGLSNEDILVELRSQNNRRVDRVIMQLYDDVLPFVRNMVSGKQGLALDHEDILQEALAVLYQKAQVEDFAMSGSIKSYLIGICKNIWYKKLRSLNRLPLDELGNLQLSDEEIDETEEMQISLISSIIQQLTEECQKVLTMFYFEKRSMKEIAQMMGYKEETVAKTKKYKCITNLRKMVTSHPQINEIRS